MLKRTIDAKTAEYNIHYFVYFAFVIGQLQPEIHHSTIWYNDIGEAATQREAATLTRYNKKNIFISQ